MLGVTSFVLACSPGLPRNGGPDPKPETPTVDEGFPKGWSQWAKFNDAPIVREAEGEARDLHYNPKAAGTPTGPMAEGTVLVKAHYALHNGGKGALKHLSTMIKGAAGWTYGVYTAEGKKKTFNKDGCALCHTQRADNDFVFSDRSGL